MSHAQKEEREMPRTSRLAIARSHPKEQVLVENSPKYTVSYYKVFRARIVLFAASGMDNEQISQILDVQRPTPRL
jgi:hypothetical protein